MKEKVKPDRNWGRVPGAGYTVGFLRSPWGLMGILLLLVLPWWLAGCPAPELRPDAELSTEDGKGALVFSLSRSGVRDFDIQLTLSGVDAFYHRVIVLRNFSDTLDWPGAPGRGPTPDTEPQGRLVALVLPAGAYEVNRWSGQVGFGGFNGDGYEMYDSDLSIRLTVRPGEVVYAGRIHFALPQEPDFLASLGASYYRIESPQSREADRRVFETRYPRLAKRIFTEKPARIEGNDKLRRYYILNFKAGDRRRVP